MDKYEFNIKVEQIKKLVGKSDFQTAMKIADTIDWRRVRNANLLSMIASVYEKNEEYQEAKDILLIAFERAPVGKRLLYKLTQLAIKQGNIQEAESYYREFCELAGDDSRQDVLRYLILKAKGASMEQLIHSLESYTSTELDEKWLYELAELYHQAGMQDKCVQTCDKIMLMFGLGQYVDKAMELKLQYAPLTKYQMDLVENRDKYEEKLRLVEQNGGSAVMPLPESSQPAAGGAVQSVQPEEAAYAASQMRGAGAAYGGEAPYAASQMRGAGAAYGGEASYAAGQMPGAGAAYGGEASYAASQMPGAGAVYGGEASYAAGQMPGTSAYGGEVTYANSRTAEEAAYVNGAAYMGNQIAGGAAYPGNQASEEDAYASGVAYANSRIKDAAGNFGAGNAAPKGMPAPGTGGLRGEGAAVPPAARIAKEQAEVPINQGAGMQQAFAGMTEESIPGRPRVEPRPIPVPPPSLQMYGQESPAVEAALQENPQEAQAPRLSDAFVQETSQAVNMGVIDEEKLVANLREAEVEASLAEEMSKISMNTYSEEPVRARTRVLNDVKELKQAEALAGKTKVLGDIRHIQDRQAANGAEILEMPVRQSRKEPAPPHMMVQARTSEIGLAIALDALKRAHQILQYKHPVAKISGEKLNQKGILASAPKLEGKDLIIEDAGDLTDAMLDELEEFLENNAGRTTVVLVDNSRQISGIRKASNSLAEKFREVGSLAEAESYLEELERSRQGQVKKSPPVNRGESPETIRQEPRRENVRIIRPEPVTQEETRPVRVEPVQQPKAEPARIVRMESAPNARREADTQTVQLRYPESKEDYRGVPNEGAARTVAKKAAVKEVSANNYQESQIAVEKAQGVNVRKAGSEGRMIKAAEEEEVMGLDEFAQYCCQYASQIDCNITGKSMLALYERIEIMEEEGIALTKTAAEDLIEEAADKAEKPSIGKRLTGLFSSKYDKEGLLILKEEHFI